MTQLRHFFSKKSVQKIIILLLAFLSVCVFCVNLQKVDLDSLQSHSRLAKFFEKITQSINGYNVFQCLLHFIIYIQNFILMEIK